MATVFTTHLLYTIFNLDLSDLSIQPRLIGPFVFLPFPFPIAKAMLVSCSKAARQTHLRRKSKCKC